MLSCEKHKRGRTCQRIRRLKEGRRMQQELRLLQAVVATLQGIGLMDRSLSTRQ